MRGLLDQLGRRQTGAIVADMLAVAVNGDLRVAMVIRSAFQTFDVVGAMLAAPLSRRTRRVLWRTFRLTFRRRSRRGDGTEEQFLAGDLTEMAMLGALDDNKASGCLLMLQFLFLVAAIAYSLTRMLVGGLVVAPIMAAMRAAGACWPTPPRWSNPRPRRAGPALTQLRTTAPRCRRDRGATCSPSGPRSAASA